MAGYVVLGRFKPTAGAMSGSVGDVGQIKARAEKMGVRVVGLWGLMGHYDILAVLDAPDEMSAVAASQTLAKGLDATAETTRAFSEDEIGQLMAKMGG